MIKKVVLWNHIVEDFEYLINSVASLPITDSQLDRTSAVHGLLFESNFGFTQ